MPVPVVCPSCGARMSAPDQFVGKKVKCPKCSSPVVVADPAAGEGFEVVDDAPAAKKPTPPRPRVVADEDDRPRRRSRPADDEDDADEEDDDRPRKKRKKPAKKSMLPLLIGGGLAAVLVVGGVVAAWLLWPRGEKPPAGGPVAGPGQPAAEPGKPGKPAINWVRFDQAGVPFTADFPNGPPQAADPLAQVQDPNQKQLIQGLGLKMTLWNRADAGRSYGVAVVEYPKELAALMQGSPEALLKQMADGAKMQLPPGAQEQHAQNITAGGLPAREMVVRVGPDKAVVSRLFLVKGVMFGLRVEGPADLALADEDVKRFFDSFQERVPGDGPPAKGKK